jgi:Mor family transcriptional regulator
MIKVAAIISFTLCSFFSYAECGGGRLYFWPKGNAIRQNSVIVIEGHEWYSRAMDELGKKYPVYLQAGNKKILLNVTSTYKGEF